MVLRNSGQMYLETIYVLSKTMSLVRAIDVCQHMGYSKPSVSRAVGILKKNCYLIVHENGHLELTEAGKKVGERTYECHTVLTEVLTYIGVPEDIASEDACKIEHDISDETFYALKKYLKTIKGTQD